MIVSAADPYVCILLVGVYVRLDPRLHFPPSALRDMGAAQSALGSATQQHSFTRSLNRSLLALTHRRSFPLFIHPSIHPSADWPLSTSHGPCIVSFFDCLSSSRPCIRCLKPFTPSADDLREAAGYQPVATQPGQSHTVPQPHTAVHASTAADSADDTTDWEDFEDFDEEQDRIEKGRTANPTAALDSQSASTSRSASTPSSTQSSTAASPLASPTHSNSASNPVLSHIPPSSSSGRPRPSVSPPRPSAAASRPSPPPTIDFFGSVGIASSGYQEPVRLQSKLQPHRQSPALSAAQRAELMSDYGLDDVGLEVGSWDDGLELGVGPGDGGAGGGERGEKGKRGKGGDKKKRGLGAVVMDEAGL